MFLKKVYLEKLMGMSFLGSRLKDELKKLFSNVQPNKSKKFK